MAGIRAQIFSNKAYKISRKYYREPEDLFEIAEEVNSSNISTGEKLEILYNYVYSKLLYRASRKFPNGMEDVEIYFDTDSRGLYIDILILNFKINVQFSKQSLMRSVFGVNYDSNNPLPIRVGNIFYIPLSKEGEDNDLYKDAFEGRYPEIDWDEIEEVFMDEDGFYTLTEDNERLEWPPIN